MKHSPNNHDIQMNEPSGNAMQQSDQSPTSKFASPEPLLVMDGVTKAYGTKVVADNLHLEINRGEFFTFLGSSGSGKSTALRIIAGLETPDTGSVRILGREVLDIPPWKRDLGMMFQQYAVFPHMSVARNIAYGLTVRKVSASRVNERVRELVSLVGLSGMEDKNVTLLSGGEQQRVALARALAHEPLILLLDEPLSALDEKIRREMQSELKRIQRSTGTTFLYVTHDQEEALTMSDRIMILHNGRPAQIGTPEEIFLRPRSAYVAKFFRGSNVLKAECVASDERASTLRLCGQEFEIPCGRQHHDAGLAKISIRAENLRIGPDLDDECIRVPAEVTSWTFRGAHLDWALCLDDGQTATATTSRRVAAPNPGLIQVGFHPQDVVLLSED